MRKLSALLDLEHETELLESQQVLSHFNAKELEKRGVCIRKLCIASQRCGFYGRTVYRLEANKHLQTVISQNTTNNKNRIFSSIFTVGDIVSIFTNAIPADNSGVITHINPTSVTVAFDQPPFPDQSFDDTNISLVKVTSDVTHKRLKRALEHLLNNRTGPSQHVISVCFENAPLLAPNANYFITNTSFVKAGKDASVKNEFEISLCNPLLNAMQRQAVVDTLSRRDISIIHGPPGTGKTTTVVECIIQSVRRSQKVLACAPSNIAVDNMLARLAGLCRVVRLGHPARAAVELQKYSLDAQVNCSDCFDIIRQVRGDIERAMGLDSKKKRRVNWLEVKELRKELHERENKAIYEILSGCDVVLSTTTSSSFDGPLRALKKGHFDVVFIDECAQAIEPACWISLLHSGKCVLAGDHLQLPPTIISEEAAKGGLSVTLMERLLATHGTGMVSLLTTQYRMNRRIMQWPSLFLYGNSLVAHESVSEQLLCNKRAVEANLYTETALLFIDTAGCNMNESDVPEEVSKSNEGEANLVSAYIGLLVRSGVSASEIAVIAPYALQVDLISHKLETEGISSVEVHTVDGFQGREKEAVIISFTRSNDKGEVGFLREVRRTNVAITRARRHLCVIGDSVTISNQSFIRGLLECIHTNGEVISAFDFQHEDMSSVASPSVCTPAPSCNQMGSNQGKGRREGVIGFVESKERERLLEEQIGTFSADEKCEFLEFPSDLSSKERNLVRKQCRELGLCYSNQGSGQEQPIVISKPTKKEIDNNIIQEPAALEFVSQSETELYVLHDSIEANGLDAPIISELCSDVPSENSLIKSKNQQQSQVICELCEKSVAYNNMVTHTAHCQRISNLDRKVELAINTAQKGKGKKSVKSRAKPLITSTATKVKDVRKELDLDNDFAVLEASIRLKDVCNFNECNASTKLISDYCQYCKLNYCIKHCQFEIHGCGNLARSDIRNSYKDSCRTIPKKQRAELEKKYQNALEAKARQRKCKK